MECAPKKVIYRTRLNQLHSVTSIHLSACRMLLLTIVRHHLEYGNEIWECNKLQADALESIIEGVILGCSSRTCNEAIRGDMGLDTLRSRGDKTKLK